MAGDASGDRSDEGDLADSSREPPATDSVGENEIGWNADDGNARERTPNDDRIPLDLSGNVSDDADEESDADVEDDPYAPEPSSTPIERGDPSLENAAFVALGALAMVLVIARIITIPL
jgi:hypothetical protein